ncbi:hypothetical protein [Acidiphilium sp.]|uniref:hypothetical protein n=1 Tax=Acidiphilium sp. TaxID=527 RepID=UPI0025875C49|nr:hypothetical protein [Acidiphilium sp.]
MTWTPAQLKAAYAALSPTPASLTDAIATLNAQTQTVRVDVPVQNVAAYLGLQGKLAAFIGWANAPPTGASAASVTAAQELAFALQHPATCPTFAMSNPTVVSLMTSWLSALVAPGTGITGPITSADQTAILALGSATVPAWQPALDGGAMQLAGVI